jgi:acetate kinase
LLVQGPNSSDNLSRPLIASDHAAAVIALIDWLEERLGREGLAGVGHRVVHGGPSFSEPRPITADLVKELRRLSPFDPEHLPGEILLVEAFQRWLPSVPQVGCFDTAFHRDLPRVARLLPIPRRYEAEGVCRYGFAGVPMSTRSGDLDPGVAGYLARTENMSAKQFHELVNFESGLLGMSETSSDIRDLLNSEVRDVRAAEAVALFCYQVKKWIGAFAAALGGLDTLVFAGGIGENSPVIRARICAGLAFLGVELEGEPNAKSEKLISTKAARVAVRVIATSEEQVIAKAVCRLLGPTWNHAN